MVAVNNDSYELNTHYGEATQLPHLNNLEKANSMQNLSVRSNTTNTSVSNATSGSTSSKNFRKKLLNKPLKTLANQSNIRPLPQEDDVQQDNNYYQENTNVSSNIQNDDRYLTPVQMQNSSYISQQQRPKYNEATV
jgi:hypothetical protein